MRHVLSAATLVLALAAPSAARAQQPAAQLAVTRAVSMPDGGWGWAEAVQLTGARVSVPVYGAAYVWAGAARGENRMATCPALADFECVRPGEIWMFQAGGDYRFRSASAVAPYMGAGASLEWWQGGARTLMPHIHAGLDLRPTPVVGVRVEAQSEWQFPARLSAGLVLSLP